MEPMSLMGLPHDREPLSFLGGATWRLARYPQIINIHPYSSMCFSGFSMKKNNHFYWGYPHDLGTPPLSKSSWKHHFRGGLPPSGNQTWHWKIPCVDHWFIKSSIYSGFPVAMFDYRRVYGTVAPCQDPEFPLIRY